MVSVLDGQLSRTWYFHHNNRKHVINLYHDTITGVRSAMLDFQEIRGSTGNSSVFMENRGHRIFFSVEDLPGYLEIKRAGWVGFAYACVINDKIIPECTEIITPVYKEIFKPKITGTTMIADEESEHPVTWYVVKTTRLTDDISTQVHRRFRDFAELNSQVKANFKGNHLLQALPPLPEKPLKSFTDHRDPNFIKDRALKLEVYLMALVNIPHVQEMVCTKAFLGLMESVREHSVSFHTPQLGISLVAGNSPKAPYGVSPDNIAVVGCIQKPEHCEEVAIGDAMSKINGVPVQGYTFEGIIQRIKVLPRPVIVHFIQVIGGLPTPPDEEAKKGLAETKQEVIVEEKQAVAAKNKEPDDILSSFMQSTAISKPSSTASSVSQSVPAAAPEVPKAAPSIPARDLSAAVDDLFRDPAAPSSAGPSTVKASGSKSPVAPAAAWRKNQLFGEDDLSDLQPASVAPPAQQEQQVFVESTTASQLEDVPLQNDSTQPMAAQETQPEHEPAVVPAVVGWD